RWEPASGRVQHFFDDDLVCASVGVHPALLRGIEPFPTTELKPYDPGFVAGWIVERYQIDLAAAAARAREAMEAKLQALCAQQVPGAIRGEYPKSPWKVALLVIGALIVLWLLLSYGQR